VADIHYYYHVNIKKNFKNTLQEFIKIAVPACPTEETERHNHYLQGILDY